MSRSPLNEKLQSDRVAEAVTDHPFDVLGRHRPERVDRRQQVTRVVIAGVEQRDELGVLRIDRRVRCVGEFVVQVALDGQLVDTRRRHLQVDELEQDLQIGRRRVPDHPLGELVDRGRELDVLVRQERLQCHGVVRREAAAGEYGACSVGRCYVGVVERLEPAGAPAPRRPPRPRRSASDSATPAHRCRTRGGRGR